MLCGGNTESIAYPFPLGVVGKLGEPAGNAGWVGLKWAWQVQHPEKKIGVSLCYRGGQGVGKGAGHWLQLQSSIGHLHGCIGPWVAGAVQAFS